MNDRLQIDLDTDVAECGGLVSGRVRWESDTSARVHVQLRYLAAGAGESDTEVADEVNLEASTTRGEQFALHVPESGPMSFKGQLINVTWQVEVVVARESDPSASVAITVLPLGGLAVWARQVGTPPQG